MRSPVRLGIRTRLLLSVVGVMAVGLAVGVVAFNVLIGQRLTASSVSLARAQAAAELSSIRVVGGRPVVQTGALETGSPFWVFDGTTAVSTPAAPKAWTAAAAALAGGPERSFRLDESLRLYAVPIVSGGTRVGTLVAGVSLDAYEETAHIALVGSFALALILLAAVALLTHWILGRAFAPVSRMTEDAAAWSDHDLGRRFEPGEPYDELTRLASTLDALLERLSASLRHEQRLTAELSHELRTPIARIAAESELALRRERTSASYRESLEAVARNAELMTRTVDALISAARDDVGALRGVSDAREVVSSSVRALADEARVSGIDVHLVVPNAPVPVAVDAALLERIVQPLFDNAVRYGRSRVTVELSVAGAAAVLTVSDDGGGVGAGEADSVFDPGVRGTAAAGVPGGAGLGLALARRLAGTAGGEVAAEPRSDGGRFVLRVPLA